MSARLYNSVLVIMAEANDSVETQFVGLACDKAAALRVVRKDLAPCYAKNGVQGKVPKLRPEWINGRWVVDDPMSDFKYYIKRETVFS